MSPLDDDLTSWDDDPVVTALTAAASSTELAGEAGALAAFRAAVPSRSRRRVVGRLGVGGAAISAVVIFSGGAAAAYTSSLPRPVQNFIAQATNPLPGPLQVPETRHASTASTAGKVGPTPTVLPSSGASFPSAAPVTTPLPSAPGGAPSAAHRAAAPTAKPHPTTSAPPRSVGRPTTRPTGTPAPTPTPTTPSTPPVDGSITISVGATSVPVNGTVTTYGEVSNADGSPVANEQVWLLERAAGGSGVSQVDVGMTGTNGSVTLTTPPLTHSVWLRLVTNNDTNTDTSTKEKSAPLLVTLQSTIMATVAQRGTTALIQVATTGAAAGDSVAIERRVAGRWQPVAANQLDDNGAAIFGVTAPTRRPDHYRAVLPRSKAHTAAVTHFLVAPA